MFRMCIHYPREITLLKDKNAKFHVMEDRYVIRPQLTSILAG